MSGRRHKRTPLYRSAFDLPRLPTEGGREPGKGSDASYRYFKEPQYSLAGSRHPYAPFPGNNLEWQSYAYDDGTTYEGLMMLDVPHQIGTIRFGNGLGGGIQDVDKGDVFEGEFDSGWAHGLGQISHNKAKWVYKGEFYLGREHGCGARYNMAPYINRVKAGLPPAQAMREAEPEIQVRYGTWLRGKYRARPDNSGRYCHIEEIRGTLEEVNGVLAKARMFTNKPDGEVTIRFKQDKRGLPAPVQQDPLHYPFGTAFLAPGPAGQCAPVPDNAELKSAMTSVARAHARIWDSYNLPYDTSDDPFWRRVEKHWARVVRKRDEAQAEAREARAARRRRQEAEAEEEAARLRAEDERRAAQEEADKEIEISDDDLIASVVGVAQQAAAPLAGAGGLPPATVFASMSLRASAAAGAARRSLCALASRPLHRRGLARPVPRARQ